MSNNFFATRLLKELDQKPALEALEETIRESRQVGFDYVDDAEAVTHFRSEVAEFEEAFAGDNQNHAVEEAGDIQLMLVELVRRRQGSLSAQTRQTARKFLKRLAFVEDKLKAEGKTWADTGSWAEDVKPNYWDKAKAAGL